jgi:hypothetical protein
MASGVLYDPDDKRSRPGAQPAPDFHRGQVIVAPVPPPAGYGGDNS